MNENCDLLEKIILGEVEGKNKAIHAYDGIVWKIRSGFLTLVFGGWAIVLKGIVEQSTNSPGNQRPMMWSLFLFSLGFAFGAWRIDRLYVRRKFRVIYALNHLIDEIRSCNGDCTKVSREFLQVAGDNADMPYRSNSYREAAWAELSVYLLPIVILVVVIMLVIQ